MKPCVWPTSQPPLSFGLLLESVFGPLEVPMPAAPHCTSPPAPARDTSPRHGDFQLLVVLPGGSSWQLRGSFSLSSPALPDLAPLPPGGAQAEGEEGRTVTGPLCQSRVPLAGLEADPRGTGWESLNPMSSAAGNVGGRLVGCGRYGATCWQAGLKRGRRAASLSELWKQREWAGS